MSKRLAVSLLLLLVLAGCSLSSKPDGCGDQTVLKGALQLASETNPVPDWNTSMSARTSVWWAEKSIEELRSESGRFHSTVGAQQVEVVSWAEFIGGDAPGVGGEILRFPRGDLRQDAGLSEVLAAGKKAVSAGQAQVISTFSYKPTEAPHSAQEVAYHEWNLQDAYRWYGSSKECVHKTVVAMKGGPLRQLELPMLKVGQGRYIGVLDDQVVTLEDEAGLYAHGSEVFWYSVPGLTSGSK